LGTAATSSAPQDWARDAALDAERRGLYLPTGGSGKTRTKSDEEKRSKTTQRQQRYREKHRPGIQQAKAELDRDIEFSSAKIRNSCTPLHTHDEQIDAATVCILQEAVAGPDPDKKKAAEKRLKQKARACSEQKKARHHAHLLENFTA
jgi:hypothetical protein